MIEKTKEQSVIFVDCFDTIILRDKSNRQIFQEWAQQVATIYDIDANRFLRIYNHTNWKMCAKKLFTQFVLQAKFDDVVAKVYEKICKNSSINTAEAIENIKKFYIDCESKTHYVNKGFINFLREEKQKGKRIYVVSDFYCGSEVLSTWLDNLGILDIFDGVFSSADIDKEKSTTKFYRYLMRKLDIIPDEVVMYGDNLWSDVFMPRVLRIKSKRISHKKRNYAKE